MEALRYTLALSSAFNTVARVLQTWLKGEDPSDSLLEDLGQKRKNCATCGDPLPEDTNVCPKCVDKKAVSAAAAVVCVAL